MLLTRRLLHNIALVLTAGFFLFVPFAKALTIPLFFPLKVSEIAIFGLFLLFISQVRHKRLLCLKREVLQEPMNQVLLALVAFAFLSTLVNSFWQYPYPLGLYEYRLGYVWDSFLKAAYVGVVGVVFLFSAHAFNRDRSRYIGYLVLGGILASLYAWYLFVGSWLEVPVVFLPGMEAEPQTYLFREVEVIRCGTFKEGNYMGLFLLTAGVLAVYDKRYKSAGFLFLSLIPTLSIMGLLGVILFLNLLFVQRLWAGRHGLRIAMVLGVEVVVLLMVAQNGPLYQLFFSRFLHHGDEREVEVAYSRVDRLNSSVVSFRLGLDNPVFGVGPYNFGLHYDQYNQDEEMVRPWRSIPNNVYGELFSEIGLPGLLLFLWFLFLLYQRTRSDPSHILRFGLLATMIYFFAFPTFTMLNVWVFFGMIASLPRPAKEVSLPEDPIHSELTEKIYG